MRKNKPFPKLAKALETAFCGLFRSEALAHRNELIYYRY
ncbi:hypothetical protein B8V81_3699 [Paenibacillus pasadenensis]|uniref:Uncharacterized protein n=1 Tax=Paenibacillus pasadenensis TaxID=217090 RepID=A0A2N5N4K4_9BACL|nr:hypothetical protein B8V81_3699 [Paenibacillus pasadenensis]